jgi:DNA helicase-2/ATP-dependent DNA helicase PcrA
MDLEELSKMSARFPTLQRFLTDISSFEEFKGETVLSGAQNDEILVLSTIHQAKGLEWEVVFLIGLNDYEFPHPKALEKQEALEEERRLFYVATTRTKTELYLTYPQYKFTSKNGLVITRASMFLCELPQDCFQEWEVITDPHYL